MKMAKNTIPVIKNSTAISTTPSISGKEDEYKSLFLRFSKKISNYYPDNVGPNVVL